MTTRRQLSSNAVAAGRVSLTAGMGLLALLAVVALPVPIEQSQSMPPAPWGQPQPVRSVSPSAAEVGPARCHRWEGDLEPLIEVPRGRRCGQVGLADEAPLPTRARCHTLFSDSD